MLETPYHQALGGRREGSDKDYFFQIIHFIIKKKKVLGSSFVQGTELGSVGCSMVHL